jgi:hypothetical protein
MMRGQLRYIRGQMIYTCYEMVRDCRADLPQGWTHFVSYYVPVIRRILAQYAPDQARDPKLLDSVLLAIRRPESSMFNSIEPAPERWFVAELRQKVVAELKPSAAEIEIGLDSVSAALQPLTMTERQAVWFETMHYAPGETGPMLRISAQTVEKVRERAAELIRGSVDAWRRTLLAENGSGLGKEALAARGKDCLPAKAFLDVIEGRSVWREREMMDQHLRNCWHCVDHFCRLVEVNEWLRGNQPLSPAEAEPFFQLLGVAAAKPSGWKRLFGKA